MRRDVLLISVLLLLALLPTILFDRKSFASYDVCPYSKTYGDVYPEGTFVLKAFCVDELSRMLRVVRKALDACDIVYYLEGGSVLGYVRHNKGMIPFDDDIDLCVFASDESMAKLRRYLPRGMALVWFRGWYKVISDRIPLLDRLAISIDIFQVEETADGNLHYQNDLPRSMWPRSYPKNLVFPVQRGMFVGVPNVTVPARPVALAKRLYGEDCMEVAYVNQVHGSMAYLATKFSLQKKPSKISLKHRLERVDGVPISVVGEHHRHGKRRPQITEIA